MSSALLKTLIERHLCADGLLETGIEGVRLFRHTQPLRCAPAVYEPSIIAIVSGTKEAIVDGASYRYDSSRYLCCTLPMPVEAGIHSASPTAPLLGVSIAINSRLMRELAIATEQLQGEPRNAQHSAQPKGITLAHWQADFSEALLRLLQLLDCPQDHAVLAEGRLRELFYAALKGDAGAALRRAFGVGNDIARAIDYLADHLNQPITIDQMARQVGMSRAVLHRKFKQATSLSPLQFIKSMRLNQAAMQIAQGTSVNQASLAVGYTSASQFNREFKRLYGQTPKQWGLANHLSSVL